ncbi:hypothetical protein ACUXCC_002020 [Cytobacillus horneckiae]
MKYIKVILISIVITLFNTQPGIENDPVRTRDWKFMC